MLASLAMVVYYADHLAHSIQADAIGKRVEQATLVVVHGRLGSVEEPTACECSNYLAHFGRAIWRYPRPMTTLRSACTAAGDRPPGPM